MKKELIINLLKEVNAQVKNKTISEMLVNKANVYHESGMNESEIFSAVLKDVKGLNNSLKNKEIFEITEKFGKFEKAPALTIDRMMNDYGLTKAVQTIKESEIYSDPVIRTTVTQIEAALQKNPEFRLLPAVTEALKPFSYDKTIKTIVEGCINQMTKNATKIMILNSIYEFKLTPSNMYQKVIAILEQSLLDDSFSADSIKMKLREQVEFPVIKAMISNLALIESRQNQKLSIGFGNQNTVVESVITPSLKLENSVVVLLNGKLISIQENSVSKLETLDLSQPAVKEFHDFCGAFIGANFTPIREGISAKMKNIEIEMKNEGQDLALYINKAKVKDINDINYGGIFIMESTSSRAQVSAVLSNLKYVTSLDFIKKVVSANESCHIITIDKNIFVLETGGNLIKMNGVNLYEYMLSKYDYNIGESVRAELQDRDSELLTLESQKSEISANITKLETSIATLDEALTKNLDADDADKVKDLRFTIEKKINSLKENYIAIDQKKKKLFETDLLSSDKKYSISEEVKLKDGRFGKITAVDTAAQRYMVRTEDGKISPIMGADII